MEVFNFERLGAEPEHNCTSTFYMYELFSISSSKFFRRPEVGRLVHPDNKGVPVGDKNPLTDVKLGVVDQQRPLYVLLHHIPGPSELSNVCGPHGAR